MNLTATTTTTTAPSSSSLGMACPPSSKIPFNSQPKLCLLSLTASCSHPHICLDSLHLIITGTICLPTCVPEEVLHLHTSVPLLIGSGTKAKPSTAPSGLASRTKRVKAPHPTLNPKHLSPATQTHPQNHRRPRPRRTARQPLRSHAPNLKAIFPHHHPTPTCLKLANNDNVVVWLLLGIHHRHISSRRLHHHHHHHHQRIFTRNGDGHI